MGKSGVGRLSEIGVATADELIEVAVENPGARLKEQVSTFRRPTHRLAFVKTFVHDLVHR